MNSDFYFKFPMDGKIKYPVLTNSILTIKETSIIMDNKGVVSKSYRIKGGAIDTWVKAENLEENGELVE